MVPVITLAAVAVALVLSGASMAITWQTVGYARQARQSRERAQAACEEIKRLRDGR